jgi:hypothetical protein
VAKRLEYNREGRCDERESDYNYLWGKLHIIMVSLNALERRGCKALLKRQP